MAIDYRTVATIPGVGANSPRDIAVARNGDVYTIDSASSDNGTNYSLGVIDRANRNRSRFGGIYSPAFGVAAALDTGHLYLSLPFMDCVAKFKPGDGSRSDISLRSEGSPRELAVPRLGTDLYVRIDSSPEGVLVINRATDTITTRIPLDQLRGVTGLTVNPDGSRIYISINYGDALAVINRATNAVEATLPLKHSCMVLSPDGTRLYVSQSINDWRDSSVIVINTATNTVQYTILLDGLAMIGSMAVSPDTPHLYVIPNYAAEAVTVINTATYAVLAPLPLGGRVDVGRMAVTPDGMVLYVFSLRGDVVVIERLIELRYLSVKVTAGSAPEWLVSRYAVECTYQTPNGTRTCGNAVFDHGGGVVEGVISDEGGAFPENIRVTVTLDFAADTGLHGVVKQFSPPVTDTGVNFFFEPSHVIQKTDLFFDLRPTPLATDYLLVRWSHITSGTALASGQKYLSGEELRQRPVTQYGIAFVLDPTGAENLRLEIVGRYQDQELTRFLQTFQLSDQAIVLRAQKVPPSTGYALVAIMPLSEKSRSPLAASSGTGVLRGTYMFDFDLGVEAPSWDTTDTWWEQMTGTARQLVPVKSELCLLGIVDFNSITLSYAKGLTYSRNPIPGYITGGANQLVDGSVFVVHTKGGNFVKVQVLHYDWDLQVRWEACTQPLKYLDVRVTIGSAPVWLVTRYVAECTYDTPDGVRSCGRGTYGPGGGIVEGQVSDEGGSFPSFIVVTVTIDFEPDTQLRGLVKHFTPEVTATGVSFIFEPYQQVFQKTDLYFDLQPTPLVTDYLLVRWKHIAGGTVVTSGQHHLSGTDLRQQAITQYAIVFVPDPVAAKDVDIEIEGRYHDVPLPLFAQTFELSEKAVLIRAQKDSSGSGFTLITA